MRALCFSLLLSVLVAASYVSCAPPVISSYSAQIVLLDNDGYKDDAIEYYDEETHSLRTESRTYYYSTILIGAPTDTSVSFNRTVCETGCFRGIDCRGRGCGVFVSGLFRELRNATLEGRCANGDNMWGYHHTDGIYTRYCISATGNPTSILREYNRQFLSSIVINEFRAGRPNAGFFEIPSYCPCTHSTTGTTSRPSSTTTHTSGVSATTSRTTAITTSHPSSTTTSHPSSTTSTGLYHGATTTAQTLTTGVTGQTSTAHSISSSTGLYHGATTTAHTVTTGATTGSRTISTTTHNNTATTSRPVVTTHAASTSTTRFNIN